MIPYPLQALAHQLKAAVRQNAEAAAVLLDALAAMPVSSVGRGVFTVSRALHIQRWDGQGWRTERLVDDTESETEPQAPQAAQVSIQQTTSTRPQDRNNIKPQETVKTVKEYAQDALSKLV